MSRYLLLFRGGMLRSRHVSPEQVQRHLERWWRWTSSLSDHGTMESGGALASSGCIIKASGDAVSDPLGESENMVSGYSTIEVEGLNEAIAIACDCPILEFNGQVEIRPLTKSQVSIDD